jgi:hypothetical protein
MLGDGKEGHRKPWSVDIVRICSRWESRPRIRIRVGIPLAIVGNEFRWINGWATCGGSCKVWDIGMMIRVGHVDGE